MRQLDFLMVQETHGTTASAAAFELPPGTRAFWSQDRPDRGGLLLLIQESFLARFFDVKKDDWDDQPSVWPGYPG